MSVRVSNWLWGFGSCPGILGDKRDSTEEAVLESAYACSREPGEFAATYRLSAMSLSFDFGSMPPCCQFLTDDLDCEVLKRCWFPEKQKCFCGEL